MSHINNIVLEIVLEILFMNPLFFLPKLFEENKNGENTMNLDNKIKFSYAHV